MAEYHRCPGCSSIFTSDDISHEVETENDSPLERNTSVRFKQILDRVGPIQGLIADFGCGNGEFIEYLRPMLEIPPLGVDKWTSAQLKEFNENSWDGFFMIEVIEHLQDPIGTLKKMLGKLKVGGFIYVESTFADSIVEHRGHPYVNPKIGHRVMLSRQALASISDVTQEWVNPNVLILRKK